MTTGTYPLPRPESGNDPRFTFGLQLDVAQVLEKHGFPPVTNGSDIVDLQTALFRFLYAPEAQPAVDVEDYSPPTFAEYRDAIPFWQRRLADAEASGDAAKVERCRRSVGFLRQRVQRAEATAQRAEWHVDVADTALSVLASRSSYSHRLPA